VAHSAPDAYHGRSSRATGALEMHMDRCGGGRGRTRRRRGGPLLALLATGLLVAGCGGSSGDEEKATGAATPAGRATQEQAPPAEGRPAQYPPEGEIPEPKTPEGITPVPVPSEVQEGVADYRTEGEPDGMELRSFEIPVSLGAGPAASPLGPELLERGLDRDAFGQGVVLVAAGNREIAFLDRELKVRDGSLGFYPGGEGNATVVPISSVLGVDTESLDRLTLAHDPFADRFLLLAVERPAERQAPASRLVLAVSGDAGPGGAWRTAEIDPAEISAESGRIEDLRGLAIDERVVCLLVTTVGADEQTRTRVYSIDKGPSGSGFYMGETAGIRVY